METKRDEPHHGGYTRFELELEVPAQVPLPPHIPPKVSTANTTPPAQFVQSLSNPHYLNHLATLKLFDDPSFVAYLSYLQYFRQPGYTRYLQYPAPTLRALELLQQERFRREVLRPEVVGRMVVEGVQAVVGGERLEA